MRKFAKRTLVLLLVAVLIGAGLPLAQASNPYNYPDYMMNNAILRALEYTGYDVQYLKDKGYLYLREYVGAYILNQSDGSAILSDIGYSDYSSSVPNGYETVSDSSTVTGLAPDIARFEQYGLVCASFVGYYICNYLPNIEGVDTSIVFDKMKEVSAYTSAWSGNTIYNLALPANWLTGLDALAKTPATTGVTKYTDEDEAYENLAPGDVIIFWDTDHYSHMAIYAGEGPMYNKNGTVVMQSVHYIIHVGNSRGPEISYVEAFYTTNSEGDKSGSVPVAFYHIEYPNSIGHIEVYKTNTSGSALSGAIFTAVNTSTGTSYIIGPTDSTGYAISEELPLGTYTVTETTFPSGYQASGQSSWTITLNTINQISTIEAVNEPSQGTLKIIKTSEDGNVEGIKFLIYSLDDDGNETWVKSPTTDADGVISLTLTPGKYRIKEAYVADSAYYTPESQDVTVVAGQTTVKAYQNVQR
ncbi:MAG: prealbumin-like fold domain-containing protein [Firmicutes bacterium]|nr:prealbumin-like fold domain-containing protein [Bacillota bacterium]